MWLLGYLSFVPEREGSFGLLWWRALGTSPFVTTTPMASFRLAGFSAKWIVPSTRSCLVRAFNGLNCRSTEARLIKTDLPKRALAGTGPR